jgi:hypothetical protein
MQYNQPARDFASMRRDTGARPDLVFIPYHKPKLPLPWGRENSELRIKKNSALV